MNFIYWIFFVVSFEIGDVCGIVETGTSIESKASTKADCAIFHSLFSFRFDFHFM